REVFEMKLNAELVVLSACNSGRGEVRTGEGVVGLTWAFFVAGVPAQVVSQWSVDDAATAVLMERFYIYLKAGRSKGEALHLAALSLLQGERPKATRALAGGVRVARKGERPIPNTQHPIPDSSTENRKWSHPYYWAPFVLMGDWR